MTTKIELGKVDMCMNTWIGIKEGQQVHNNTPMNQQSTSTTYVQCAGRGSCDHQILEFVKDLEEEVNYNSQLVVEQQSDFQSFKLTATEWETCPTLLKSN